MPSAVATAHTDVEHDELSRGLSGELCLDRDTVGCENTNTVGCENTILASRRTDNPGGGSAPRCIRGGGASKEGEFPPLSQRPTRMSSTMIYPEGSLVSCAWTETPSGARTRTPSGARTRFWHHGALTTPGGAVHRDASEVGEPVRRASALRRRNGPHGCRAR